MIILEYVEGAHKNTKDKLRTRQEISINTYICRHVYTLSMHVMSLNYFVCTLQIYVCIAQAYISLHWVSSSLQYITCIARMQISAQNMYVLPIFYEFVCILPIHVCSTSGYLLCLWFQRSSPRYFGDMERTEEQSSAK